jgi:hypothetical protein
VGEAGQVTPEPSSSPAIASRPRSSVMPCGCITCVDACERRAAWQDVQPNITGLFPTTAKESPVMNEITPTLVEGELRMLDTDLAQRLGFAQPLNIRNTIKRHESAVHAVGGSLHGEETPLDQPGSANSRI